MSEGTCEGCNWPRLDPGWMGDRNDRVACPKCGNKVFPHELKAPIKCDGCGWMPPFIEGRGSFFQEQRVPDGAIIRFCPNCAAVESPLHQGGICDGCDKGSLRLLRRKQIGGTGRNLWLCPNCYNDSRKYVKPVCPQEAGWWSLLVEWYSVPVPFWMFLLCYGAVCLALALLSRR